MRPVLVDAPPAVQAKLEAKPLPPLSDKDMLTLSEFGRQYSALVKWQEWAIIGIICGPLIYLCVMIMAFLSPGLAVAAFIAASWLFFSGILSVIILVLVPTMIVIVVTRKPAIRVRVAEMGVDPTEWCAEMDARPADTLRVCIVIVGIAVLAVLVVSILVALIGRFHSG